jgi:hypothetical protein
MLLLLLLMLAIGLAAGNAPLLDGFVGMRTDGQLVMSDGRIETTLSTLMARLQQQEDLIAQLTEKLNLLERFAPFGPTALVAASEGRVVVLAAADLDGDGDQDIVAGSMNNMLVYHLNHRDGTFTSVPLGNASVSPTGSLVAEDITGDGAPDIICATFTQNAVLVFKNDLASSGSFIELPPIPASEGSRFVLIADIDSDVWG